MKSTFIVCAVEHSSGTFNKLYTEVYVNSQWLQAAWYIIVSLSRDAVKTYYVEKEERSESDVEVLRESQSQEWEDQSHVHFSLDTSYKVKCEVRKPEIIVTNLKHYYFYMLCLIV